MRETQCCWCCCLRTGTIIIGYVSAIEGFIATSGCSIMMYISNEEIPPDIKKDKLLVAVFGICSVVALIQLFVSVSLIYGCYTGKRGFLVPWKVFAWLCFGLTVVAVGHSLIRLLLSGDITMLILAAGQLILAVLLWYLIAVVRSYEDSLVQQTNAV